MAKRTFDEIEASQHLKMINHFKCSFCLGNFPTVSTVCCSKLSHIACLSKWKNVEGRRGVSHCPLCHDLYPEPERTMRISELKYIFNEDIYSEESDKSMPFGDNLLPSSFQAFDESVIPYKSENSCVSTDNETKRSPYSEVNKSNVSVPIVHQVAPCSQIQSDKDEYYNLGEVIFDKRSIPFTGVIYKEFCLPHCSPILSSALARTPTLHAGKGLQYVRTFTFAFPITYTESSETSSEFGYIYKKKFGLEFPNPQDTKSILPLIDESEYDDSVNANEISKNNWSDTTHSDLDNRDETSSLSNTDSENEGD